MMNDLTSVLDDQWRRLERRPKVDAAVVAVSELPVPTANGSLAAGLDRDGNRHLLVPIGAHQIVRKGLNGPVLRLTKRALEHDRRLQDYADLVCLRRDLDDIFATLCADILVATETSPENPVKVLHRVLDRWRALFLNPGPPLGAQQLAGLFGELVVLELLLEHDSGAIRSWKGPSGYQHDFATAAGALEVKTSTNANGRSVRIHGLEQLEPPLDGVLGLVWLRLEADAHGGIGFLELIKRVLDLSDDESEILTRLAAAGYRAADNDHYAHARYSIGEQRWYNVDVAFPRLTTVDLAAAAISTNVRNVDYTIDLSGDSPAPMETHDVERHIKTMLEETR
ncbi:PD-(D/E)XK motif protein [Nocardia asteroides]|uniref:PD-(D/E)XK motif protein n=1 Tax=Nocardia asteroides TaxID=1824 RepID=UPI001E552EA1|nr:PD-(D/E)XK motif protein [Nocardia asteroides]UGT56944.1 PD-(D/E)XK motif protein [Nocardia asteroides]